MAKIFFEGEDVREKQKVCYICGKEITADQVFAMELTDPPRYKHGRCNLTPAS